MGNHKKALNKVCSRCGEISLAGSARCMVCGASFDEASSKQRAVWAKEPRPSKPLNMTVFGLPFHPAKAAVWFVGFALLYMLVFIASLHPLESPLRRLVMLGLGTVLSTAILLFADLKYGEGLGEEDESVSGRMLAWLGLIVFVWPAGFPLYYRARARAGRTQYKWAAYMMAALFLASFVVVYGIASTRDKQDNPSEYKPGKVFMINGKPVSFSAKGPQLIVIDNSTTLPSQAQAAPARQSH